MNENIKEHKIELRCDNMICKCAPCNFFEILLINKLQKCLILQPFTSTMINSGVLKDFAPKYLIDSDPLLVITLCPETVFIVVPKTFHIRLNYCPCPHNCTPLTFYFIFTYYHPLDDLFPDFLLYFRLSSPTRRSFSTSGREQIYVSAPGAY